MEGSPKFVPCQLELDGGHPNLFQEQVWCRLDGESTQICSGNKSGVNSMEDVPQICSGNKSGVDSM